jgi:hypothetical protein
MDSFPLFMGAREAVGAEMGRSAHTVSCTIDHESNHEAKRKE